MKRYLAVPILLSMLQMTGLAAPAPPFEDLLERAKYVLIVDVLSTDTSTEHHTVTFHVVAVLRGDSTKEFRLSFDFYEDFQKGSQWLLLSQGDNRYGEPKDILGRPMDGQLIWRGWTPLRLSKMGKNTYASSIYSFCDGEPYWDIQSQKDGDFLELSRIKRLVQRFPYNPSINK